MRTPVEMPMPDVDLVEVHAWRVDWDEIARRIGTVFARAETRTRAMAYLASLLSPAERKKSWQLAERSGDQHPYGFQHLLGRADWEPEERRDRRRAYGTASLHAPDTVGGSDATGFRKKRPHSAGVARQYSGTAGRIEKSHIGVFFADARRYGHTRRDRALSLPAAWTAARERCRRAGMPAARAFTTKPVLARQRLERTRTAGGGVAWGPGDSISGDDRTLRQWLEAQRPAYVLAVSGQESVWLPPHQRRRSPLLKALPAEGWERLRAGRGSKGPRWYAGRRVAASPPPQEGWQRWGLLRRSIAAPTEMTASSASTPAQTVLAERVRVAGRRWTVEARLQTAHGEVGLAHYEVRRWTGWYRHRTLARWAQAFVAVMRAATGTEVAPQQGGQGPRKTKVARCKAHRGLRSA